MANVKKHALMRYLQRMNNEVIINDNTFVNWSANELNKIKIKEAEEQLNLIFKAPDFKYTGKLTTEKSKVDYLVSEEHQCVLVASGQDIITYYPLIYSDHFDKKANLDLFKNIKRLFDKTNNKLSKLELKSIKKTEVNNDRIGLINTEINSLEERIKSLKEKRSSYEFENKSFVSEKESLKKELESLVIKMVKPITVGI